MILKKSCFSIYLILLVLLVVLQSCEQKTQKKLDNKSRKAEINRLINLGDNYFKKGIYDSSYFYFNKAHLVCDVKKDIPKIIYSLSNMATIQQNQGDYSGSETTVIGALAYLKYSTKTNCKWNIYTILGNNYNYTADYTSALYYFNKALDLKTNQLLKNAIQNNIALTYMEQEDFHKAIQILSPLILKKEVLNNSETYSRILDNLGYCYFKVGNPKAFNYLNQSTRIREQNKDDWGLIGSYTHFTEYYKKSNRYLVIYFARLTYEKATKLNSVDDRLNSLATLMTYNNSEKSKQNSLLYLKINDSITKVRQKAKNNFAKIKYDSKKEKDENLKLKEQKVNDILKLQVQKSKTQALYFVILMILILTGLIYFYLKSKNRREKIQAAYTTEIKIAKKLHDELANDLYQMITFAETQDLSTENNKETLLHNLDTIYLRTRNISKENSYIDTGINFIPTLKEMITDFNTDIANVLLSGLDSINWISIENTKKITVYRVLQELLVNMKKHSNCNLVVISFKLNNNTIDLNYSDNGIGVKDQKINKKNGLENIEKRIEDIEGTIDYNSKSSRGFTVNIKFPV
ncbi:ATP-binding protein [Flavobacterium sp. WC2429]|uniref:histidine kinase n=2 Tax=unclassified Flavobacterium TaxID=196869 RepID=A0AB39W9N8_9FLAO